MAPWLECIDNPILFTRTDLHEREQAIVSSEIMMFCIDSYFGSLLELLEHLKHTFVGIDIDGGRTLDRLVFDGLPRLKNVFRVFEI